MSELWKRLHPQEPVKPEWVRRAEARQLPVKAEGTKK